MKYRTYIQPCIFECLQSPYSFSHKYCQEYLGACNPLRSIPTRCCQVYLGSCNSCWSVSSTYCQAYMGTCNPLRCILIGYVKHTWVLVIPFALFQPYTLKHIWVLATHFSLFQPDTNFISPVPLPYNILTKNHRVIKQITDNGDEVNHHSTT